MKAILRIIDGKRIIDYDLSEYTEVITYKGFKAYLQNGQWAYLSDIPIKVNGVVSRSGTIMPKDIYVMNESSREAIMIMEKPCGKTMYIALHESISIGRVADNLIRINEPIVSSYNCKVFYEDGKWYIKNLSLSNGTILNDLYVDTQVLKRGDVIKIGRYTLVIDDCLCISNISENVTISEPLKYSEKKETLLQKKKLGKANESSQDYRRILPDIKPYPFFSRSTRIIQKHIPITINIESAPTIGEKPGMGMVGLALSPALLAVSLGMQVFQYGLKSRKYNNVQKKRAEIYANYLASIEDTLQKHEKEYRSYLNMLYPPLSTCINMINGPDNRLWEKQPSDSDFLSLRIGTGTIPSTALVTIPSHKLSLSEDEFASVPGQIADKYRMVEDMPIACNLIEDGNCGIVGRREQTMSMAMQMITQIAALHSYDEVKIVALFPEVERSSWEWLRWLPHCMSESRDMRYTLSSAEEAKPVLEELSGIFEKRIHDSSQWNFGNNSSSGNMPHYVFIVADPILLTKSAIGSLLMKNRTELGVSGIFLGNSLSDFPNSVKNVIDLSLAGNGLAFHRTLKGEFAFKPMQNSTIGNYDSFARKMAPIRLVGGNSKQVGIPSFVSLLEGLSIGDLSTVDIGEYWDSSYSEKTLSVPIGIKTGGDLFYFDIHEKGQGVHGLVGGMPGSGKSQMAQTWIASMALHFSPEDVNFILVDFKGDSLLKPFEKLPHIAGTISNLDKDVARSFVAIDSEMDRRMQLFSDMDIEDIKDYHKVRKVRGNMPALPYLIIVVDEFADFKTKFPDFMKPIERIFALGRALGVFVVLMTQQPAAVVTTLMQNNAHFSWCLAVKDEAASKAVLGKEHGEAATLKNPGRAYVEGHMAGTFDLVQSFFSGADYFSAKEKKAQQTQASAYAVGLNGMRRTVSSKNRRKGSSISELDALVNHIALYAKNNSIDSAKPIWTQELSDRFELEELIELGRKESHPLVSGGAIGFIGIADDPHNQRQIVLQHHFRKDGNLAVYGMPGSGKTTFLQSFVISMCLERTPNQAQVHILEMGKYALRSLDAFPNVGIATGDDEPDVMMKTIELLKDELEKRKKLFRRYGVNSPDAYEEATGDKLPDMILVLDDLNQNQNNFDFMNSIIKLSVQGVSFGLYVVCAFNGTTGINYSLTQNINKVYALKLKDKSDYTAVVGKTDINVEEIYGRGLVRYDKVPLLFQTAIYKASLSDAKRSIKIREIALEKDKGWTGDRPEGVVIVPDDIPYGSLCGEPIILGLDYVTIKPINFSMTSRTTLVISDGVRDGLCALRMIIKQIAQLPGAEIILLSKRMREYSDVENIEKIQNGKDLDQMIETLRVRLKERQNELAQNSGCRFSPLVIALDHYFESTEELNVNTIRRLEAWANLGKDLGIMLVVADSAQNYIKSMASSTDILFATMRKGARLLVGGRLNEHQIYDMEGTDSRTNYALKEDEAYLVDGKISHVKLMSDY